MSFGEELYKVILKMAPVSKGLCRSGSCENQRKDEFYRRNLKDIRFCSPACLEMI